MDTQTTTTEQAVRAATRANASFDIDEWVSGLLNSSSKTVQALLFFTFFYVLGVLCRRYLRFVLWSSLVLLVVIKWLEFQNALVVDWQVLLEIFGLEHGLDPNMFFASLFMWIKENIFNFAAGLVGFLVGYRPKSHRQGLAIKLSK